MSNKIDEQKLKAAREKLACHIEPPKGSAYAEMLAKANAGNNTTEPSGDAETASSCSAPVNIPVKDGKVRLTEMTTAGG